MKISYSFNPDIPFVKEGIKGNILFDGCYANGNEPDPARFNLVLKWLFSSNPQRMEKKKDSFALNPVRDLSFFSDEEDGIVWLGHSTFLLRIAGVTMITDPVFGSLPMVKRRTPFPFQAGDIKNIRYVLQSHAHRDHFDENSIRKFSAQNPQAEFLIPMSVGNLLRKISHNSFQEAAWYQKFRTDQNPEIIFLPARHWHRRQGNDFNKALWGSFLIRTKNFSLYFAGDTASSTHFKEIGELFGPVDICLMPIGAYKPQYLMKHAHTTPEEAVQGFHDLRGKVFIPMHYGTFDLSDEPPGEPVRDILKLKEQGSLHGKLCLLQPGTYQKFSSLSFIS